MDTELQATTSHLKLCRMLLQRRLSRLEATKSKLSRHYSTLQHTRTLLDLVLELEGVVIQDPNNWDDEPESVPF